MESLYKRHTPFSMIQYKTVIEGDIIKISPRGDLVSYIYLTRTLASTGLTLSWDWQTINEFKWYIGQTLVDTQNINFIRYVAPTIMSRNFSKLNLNTAESTFLPLAFSFCTDLPFPLVSLNFDPMYLKLSFGTTYDPSLYNYEVHIMYIYLDKPERDFFSSGAPLEIQISQTNLLTNLNDVALRGPIKFIATPPVKIPAAFTYSYTVNGKTTEQYNYTGAELMFHNTNYTQRSINSADVFPPNKLNAQTTFIESPYSVGNYTIIASSNNSNAWKARDTSWRSEQPITTIITYTASASSNTSNAWKSSALAPNAWKSDVIYGQKNTYYIDASSNTANAYNATTGDDAGASWISDKSAYGNVTSVTVTASASSNIANAYAVNDGKDYTSWTSDSQQFYSDDVGTYLIGNVSSGTNAMNAFTNGSNEWVSANSYGVFIDSGQYTINPTPASVITSTGGTYRSVVDQYGQFEAFGLYINTASVNAQLTPALFADTVTQPWVSDVDKSIYGYGTSNGIYSTTATSNVANSYFVANTSGKSWTSDPTYQKAFTSGFGINSTSNSLYISNSFDYNTDTSWTANDAFGYTSISGLCNVYGTSNTRSTFAWFAFDSNSATTWYSGNIYGNVLLSGTFGTSASSNTVNAYCVSNIGNAWISTNNFGIFSLTPGIYTSSNSYSVYQGDASNLFGNSSTWISNSAYGSLLPCGVYGNVTNTGNAFINTTPYSWVGTTNVSTATATANIVYDYFTYYGSNAYMTASANVTNAYVAFVTTPIRFLFGTSDYKITYSTPQYYTIAGSTTSGATSYTDFDEPPGTIVSYTTPSSSFSYMLLGQYTIAYNYIQSPPTYWAPNGTLTTTNVYNEFSGTTTTPPSASITFPTTLPSGYQSTGQTFNYSPQTPASATYLPSSTMCLTTSDFTTWVAGVDASPTTTFTASSFAYYSGNTYTLGSSPSGLSITNIAALFGYTASGTMSVADYIVNGDPTAPDFYITLSRNPAFTSFSSFPSISGIDSTGFVSASNQLRLHFTQTTKYTSSIPASYSNFLNHIGNSVISPTQGGVYGDFLIILSYLDADQIYQYLNYSNVSDLLSTRFNNFTFTNQNVSLATSTISGHEYFSVFSIISSAINQVLPSASSKFLTQVNTYNNKQIDFYLPVVTTYAGSPYITQPVSDPNGIGSRFGVFKSGTQFTLSAAFYITTPSNFDDIKDAVPSTTKVAMNYIAATGKPFIPAGATVCHLLYRFTIDQGQIPSNVDTFNPDPSLFSLVNSAGNTRTDFGGAYTYYDGTYVYVLFTYQNRSGLLTSAQAIIVLAMTGGYTFTITPFTITSDITTNTNYNQYPYNNSLYTYSSTRSNGNIQLKKIDFSNFFTSYSSITEYRVLINIFRSGNFLGTVATTFTSSQQIYTITQSDIEKVEIYITHIKKNGTIPTTSCAPIVTDEAGNIQYYETKVITPSPSISATQIISSTLPIATGIINYTNLDYTQNYTSVGASVPNALPGTASISQVYLDFNFSYPMLVYIYKSDTLISGGPISIQSSPITFSLPSTISIQANENYIFKIVAPNAALPTNAWGQSTNFIDGSGNRTFLSTPAYTRYTYSFAGKTFGQYGATREVPTCTNSTFSTYEPFSFSLTNSGSVIKKLESSIYKLIRANSQFSITGGTGLTYTVNPIINGTLQNPAITPDASGVYAFYSDANGISITATSLVSSTKNNVNLQITRFNNVGGEYGLNYRYTVNRQISIGDILDPNAVTIIPANKLTSGNPSITSSDVDKTRGGLYVGGVTNPTFIVNMLAQPRPISNIKFFVNQTCRVTFYGVTSAPSASSESITYSNTITFSPGASANTIYFSDGQPQNVYKVALKVESIATQSQVILSKFSVYTAGYPITNTNVNGSSGGPYSGAITTGPTGATSLGHYVQYSTFVGNTISKIIISDTNILSMNIHGSTTFNDSVNTNFTKIGKFNFNNGSTVAYVGGTTDYKSFRFVITDTPTTSGTKDVYIGNIQIYFTDGRVNFLNATSNSAMSFTDGLDVSVYRPGQEDFGQNPRLLMKKSVPFRGVIEPTLIPSYKYMFYGNIMSNITLSNTVIICSNGSSSATGTFTNVWVGPSAVTGFTQANKFTGITGQNSNIFYLTPSTSYSMVANTSTALRITALNLDPGFKFYMGTSSTSGVISSVQEISGTFTNGGVCSNIGGGASITFNLPFAVQVSSYIIQTKSNSWSLYGGSTIIDSKSGVINGGELYQITSPSSYSTYRFVITESSTLYASIDYLLLCDQNGRPVVKSFGTYTSNTSIANCPVGTYTTNAPNVIGRIDTSSSSTTVTITFPQSVTMTSIMAIVSSGGTYSFGGNSGYTSGIVYYITQTGTTFTVTASAGCYIQFVSLYNSLGEITPVLTQQTQLVTYDTKFGGKYIGTTTTAGVSGEWVQLNVPSKNPIFSYRVTPRPAGFTLLESVDGSTFSSVPVDKQSNIYMVDDGTAYTFSSLISNNAYRLVITETIGNTSAIINSVNLYARSNVIKVQTLDYPVYGTTYTPLVNPGVAASGTFDQTNRNWTSNSVTGDVSFTTTFSNVNVLTKMTYENSISVGLFIQEGYLSPPTSINEQYLTTTPGLRNYYSGLISTRISGQTNGVHAYGYIYAHTSSFTLRFRGTPGTVISIWFNAGTVQTGTISVPGGSILPQPVDFVFSGCTIGTLYTLRIYSSYEVDVSIVVGVQEYTDTTDWVFAENSTTRRIMDYPTGFTFNNGIVAISSLTPKLFTNVILSLAQNSPPYKNIKVTATAPSGTQRVNMNNIKFYDRYGLVNVPGSFGGNCMTSAGEYVEYTLPMDTKITDYSVTTNASAWILSGSTTAIPSTYETIDAIQWDGKSNVFTVNPSKGYTKYRMTVTETYGAERVYMSNLRLFSNCNEVTPYMYNNSTLVYKCINTALVGVYSINSSYSSLSQQFDSFNTSVQSVVTNDEIIKNASISSTFVIDSSPKLLYGGWVEIGFPKSVSANIFSIQVINVGSTANIFTIAGSNERVNWYVSNINTGFIPSINNTYLFKAVNTPFRYYRLICKNTYDTSVTTFNIGKFSILDANCNQLNSQIDPVNLNIRDVNVFGGVGQESLTINVASSFKLGGILSNANISNITVAYSDSKTVFGTFINPEIYGNYSLFRTPAFPSPQKSFTIITNRVKYGTLNVISATDIQLLDSTFKYVLPTFTDNTFTAPPQVLPAVSFFNQYTCSNIYPFDDDSTTTWSNNSYNSTSLQPLSVRANVDITFPFPTKVVGYSLLNPYIGSWEIRDDTEAIRDTNSGSNVYYPLATQSFISRFRLSIKESIPGSNIVALDGLVLYDVNGRISPKMTGLTMNIVSDYTIFGGSNVQSANIIGNVPYNANANSITICANPFPSSFTVYANTGAQPALTKLLSVANMYTQSNTMSFPLDAYRPVSNLIFSSYSTSQINTIQYYDYNGTALFPQYITSGFDYTTKYSSESVGPYSVTASSNAANARLAFNGVSTNFYQNLTGSLPPTSLLANGFALYYGNNIIFNCTDFRDLIQATRGKYISGGTTTYRWTSNTLLSSLITSSQSGIALSADGYSFTLTNAQNFAVTFQNGTSIVDPYKTSGIIGEWLQIQLPAASTNIQYFTIQSTNITACKVLGSSNLITWTDLTSSTPVSLNTPVKVTSAITSFYYIRLVVTAPLNSTFQVTDFALYNENGRINSYL